MRYLADTNILLRSSEPRHRMHSETVDATRRLLENGEEVCVGPQNLIEFWAVATRPPSANGLGMTTAQTNAELVRIKTFFRFLPDTGASYQEWERIVGKHRVVGKNTHDARIVAAMNVHGVTHLLNLQW